MLYLSEKDVKALSVTPDEIVSLVENAFHERRIGRVFTCPKQSLSPGSGSVFFQSLPSVRTEDYASVKWIGVSDETDRTDMPQIKSLICLNDARTAEPLAILEANWITGMRTAAVSLLGARLLLGRVEGVLGIIGTGVQALTHLELFAEVGFPSRAVVWGRNSDRASQVCDTAKSLGFDACVARSHNEVLWQADIVVSVLGANTTSDVGLDGTLLKKTAYLSLVDLGRPWKSDTLRHVDMYTDDCKLTRALMDRGALPVSATLAGDLVSRAGNTDLTVVDTPACLLHPGVGYADLAVASGIFEMARARKVGTQL